MWRWIEWILKTVCEFLRIRRESTEAAEAEKKAEEERRRSEEAARELEQDIQEDVQSVVRPDLDASPDSEDPMGVGRWNRGD